MQIQEGDVLLCQTPDDGEINVEEGVVEMSGGLETSAYLALFGGNEDDDGLQDNSANWWGNVDENIPARQYRSETQNLLRSLPAIPANLRRIEQAATRDLNYLVDIGAATSVEAEASVPGLNKIQIIANINAEGEEQSFTFLENWKAAT